MLKRGLALLCVLTGCGVQALGAVQARDGGGTPLTANLGGRIVGTRSDGVYAGGDVVLGVPHGGGFGIRHGIATVGHRWLGHPLSFELGADVGAGRPAMLHWDGTALYMGASSTLLYRLCGRQDTDVGYAPAAVLWDLALSARGGVWSRPEGDDRNEVGDAAVLLGLRMTVVSDLAVPENRNWRP